MKETGFSSEVVLVLLTHCAVPNVMLDLHIHSRPEEQRLDSLSSSVSTRVAPNNRIMKSLEDVKLYFCTSALFPTTSLPFLRSSSFAKVKAGWDFLSAFSSQMILRRVGSKCHNSFMES